MAGGGWLSCCCPRNPIGEPLNASLLNSPVIQGTASMLSAGPCHNGALNFYFSGIQMAQEAWREAYSSSVCSSSYSIFMLSRFPNLKHLLCLRPGMLFYENHFLFKHYAGIRLFFFPPSLSHHFDFPIAMVFHHNCFSSFWNSHLFYELRVEHGGGGTHCFSPSMQTSYRFYLCQSHGWGDTHMYIYIFGVCEGAGIIIWIDFYVLLSWNIISLTVFKSFVLAKEKLNLKVCPMWFPFCAYHF